MDFNPETSSESSVLIKNIDDTSETKEKQKPGPKEVIKVNHFRKLADSARYTKKIDDTSILPSNFVNKVTKEKLEYEVEKIYTKTKTFIKTKTIINKTREINHQDVQYDGTEYTVIYILSFKKPVLCIIDKHDKQKFMNESLNIQKGWIYVSSKGSIHCLIMGNPPSDKYSVDHMNRIRRDNRRSNLRFKTQQEQNQNQFIRDRKIELPEDCGFELDDIPKHVYYKNEKDRGERFEIDINGFPHLPKNLLRKKTTCRKDVSLKVKLQEAIYYLRWLCEKYPELKTVIRINKEDEEERLRLTKEYNEIISLTNYPKEVIQANLVDFIYDCKTEYSIDNEELVEKVVQQKESGKKTENNLPQQGGVSKSDIPKYCYYVPASQSRGDKFTIDGHPNLLKTGKRQLSTPESKLMSTKEKFDILLQYLDCLEKGIPIVKKETPKGKRGQFCEKEAPRKKITTITETIIIPLPEKQIQEEPKKVYISDTSTLDENDKKNIPRYVYYKPTDKEHGSYWFIKDHPELISRNIKIKCSRTSALLSDKEKYDEILIHLDALDKNQPFVSFPTIRASKNSIHKEKSTKSIPPNWNLEENPIPEYLYYRHCDNKRGDTWIIKGHPKQEKAMITTTTSKEKTTIEKYNQAMNIIQSFA
jgi:hypothetical protein